MEFDAYTRMSPGGAEAPSFLASLRGRHDSASSPRQIALVGNFAPLKCGIATFTTDLFEQLGQHHPEVGVDVYALDTPSDGIEYEGIADTISRLDASDYARVARRINESAVDAVWLQHEYGIFGGEHGSYVCDFVDRLAAPLILTLHTVLTDPGPDQRAILDHLIARASRVMVMSNHSRDLLCEIHHAPAHLIDVIPHGAPDRPFGRQEKFKAELGHTGRHVLMTFGLLSPGKGVERVIQALPAILATKPDTIYRIVGATHPKLVAEQGEAYRDSLKSLADRLGVAHAIVWDNRFIETEELLDQLEACDIYVTPYFNLQQSTSGTLSYAVALGKAVVSTPYVHARELLGDGVGKLIEPDSAEAIAEAVSALLADPKNLADTQRRAYAKGRETIWPRFAAASAALVETAIAPARRPAPLRATPGLSGFFTMCDHTGMYQHAIGIVPDRRHGYCLDDNARALMLMNVADGVSAQERELWSSVFASFIQHAWNQDLGVFRNFMRFDRGWCEDVGSDDSNGRAIWALGRTAEISPLPGIREWALRWFETTLPAMERSAQCPRAMAFAMLGACAVLRQRPDHRPARALIEQGADLLYRLLGGARRPDWAWFEAVLGYDNPRLPQALIEAALFLDDAEMLNAGLETLDWIARRQRSASGNFRAVGSTTFGNDYDNLPFDQQPLEAQAAIEAANSAFVATGDPHLADHALAAWQWFFGANDRGVVLGDLAAGRCRDGINPRGANENCGAESILAFQLSHYSMLALAGAPKGDSTGDMFETGSHHSHEPLAHP